MSELYWILFWFAVVGAALLLVRWRLGFWIYRGDGSFIRRLLVEQAADERLEDLTINALLLTDVCMAGPLKQNIVEVKLAVAGWSREERATAFQWATLEHLHASDNPEVRRIPCPPHVQILRGRYFP